MRSRTRAPNLTLVALTALWLTGCTGAAERDAGVPEDSGVAADAGFPDSGVATEDAGLPDTGVGEPDTGVVPDSGELPDSGEVTDSGELPDSGDIPDTGDVPDTGVDAGEVDGGDGDAGHVDAGAPDTGIPPDAGVPGVCTDGEEGCLCAFGQAQRPRPHLLQHLRHQRAPRPAREHLPQGVRGGQPVHRLGGGPQHLPPGVGRRPCVRVPGAR